MPKTVLRLAIVLAALPLLAGATAASAAPADVAAALASPARPSDDRAQDSDRRAADVAAFARVKPGDKVADMFPGGGYYSRLFSKIVGPQGRVYGVVRQASKASEALAGNPDFPNIVIAAQPWDQLNPPEKLDLVFSSLFFHDLYNPEYGATGGGPAGVARVNQAIFQALKPGGAYVIIDHAGRDGSGYSEIATLHRIEQQAVVQSLRDAGFVLDGESPVLRNPDDRHGAAVTDPVIRGNTDRFMLRFVKPAK